MNAKIYVCKSALCIDIESIEYDFDLENNNIIHSTATRDPSYHKLVLEWKDNIVCYIYVHM